MYRLQLCDRSPGPFFCPAPNTTFCGYRRSASGRHVACCPLHVMHHSSLTACCPSRVMHHTSLTACCPSRVMHHSSLTACCPLHVMHHASLTAASHPFQNPPPPHHLSVSCWAPTTSPSPSASHPRLPPLSAEGPA